MEPLDTITALVSDKSALMNVLIYGVTLVGGVAAGYYVAKKV